MNVSQNPYIYRDGELGPTRRSRDLRLAELGRPFR